MAQPIYVHKTIDMSSKPRSETRCLTIEAFYKKWQFWRQNESITVIVDKGTSLENVLNRLEMEGLAEIKMHPVYGPEIVRIFKLKKNNLFASSPHIETPDAEGDFGLPYVEDKNGKKEFLGVRNLDIDENSRLRVRNVSGAGCIDDDKSKMSHWDNVSQASAYTSALVNAASVTFLGQWSNLTYAGDTLFIGSQFANIHVPISAVMAYHAARSKVTRMMSNGMRNLGINYSRQLFEYTHTGQTASLLQWQLFLLSQAAALSSPYQGINSLYNFTLLRRTFGLSIFRHGSFLFPALSNGIALGKRGKIFAGAPIPCAYSGCGGEYGEGIAFAPALGDSSEDFTFPDFGGGYGGSGISIKHKVQDFGSRMFYEFSRIAAPPVSNPLQAANRINSPANSTLQANRQASKSIPAANAMATPTQAPALLRTQAMLATPQSAAAQAPNGKNALRTELHAPNSYAAISHAPPSRSQMQMPSAVSSPSQAQSKSQSQIAKMESFAQPLFESPAAPSPFPNPEKSPAQIHSAPIPNAQKTPVKISPQQIQMESPAFLSAIPAKLASQAKIAALYAPNLKLIASKPLVASGKVLAMENSSKAPAIPLAIMAKPEKAPPIQLAAMAKSEPIAALLLKLPGQFEGLKRPLNERLGRGRGLLARAKEFLMEVLKHPDSHSPVLAHCSSQMRPSAQSVP